MGECRCGVDVHAHVDAAIIRAAIAGSPSARARRLYYDTLVFDTPTLRRLVEQFGASQLMIGTDYPFNFHDSTPTERIRAAIADPAIERSLLQDNARRFLGLAA